MLPDAALARMSDVQRTVDANMALRLVEAGRADGAVLIAAAAMSAATAPCRGISPASPRAGRWRRSASSRST